KDRGGFPPRSLPAPTQAATELAAAQYQKRDAASSLQKLVAMGGQVSRGLLAPRLLLQTDVYAQGGISLPTGLTIRPRRGVAQISVRRQGRIRRGVWATRVAISGYDSECL